MSHFKNKIPLTEENKNFGSTKFFLDAGVKGHILDGEFIHCALSEEEFREIIKNEIKAANVIAQDASEWQEFQRKELAAKKAQFMKNRS